MECPLIPDSDYIGNSYQIYQRIDTTGARGLTVRCKWKSRSRGAAADSPTFEASSIYQRDILTSITQPTVRFILFAFSFFIAKVAFPKNH
ncbi:MAG: hypothetical protein WAK17_15570 [Candidatus Nitrosopolaris sp.]|jgi:hypothetical protein